MIPSPSSILFLLHAKRCTVETWHKNGWKRRAGAADPPDTLHSSMSPSSIPMARSPPLPEPLCPTHDNAVMLFLNCGRIMSCLTEVPFWTAQILTVLSLEPVANSWQYGFQEHVHIILLCASCLAMS